MQMLGDRQEAEECVSDALLAAWNSIPPQRPEKLPAYLARLTRNLALKRRRDAMRLKRGGGCLPLALEELDECLPGGADVERELERKELSSVIERFLRSLPACERQIFLGRYWYFERVKSLAARFGYSESKVKSMLFRTREKLKVYLEKEDMSNES